MITHRYRSVERPFLTRRDVLRLALIGVIVVVGATTWRQVHVAAAPVETYSPPGHAQAVGMPVVLRPGEAEWQFPLSRIDVADWKARSDWTTSGPQRCEALSIRPGTDGNQPTLPVAARYGTALIASAPGFQLGRSTNPDLL